MRLLLGDNRELYALTDKGIFPYHQENTEDNVGFRIESGYIFSRDDSIVHNDRITLKKKLLQKIMDYKGNIQKEFNFPDDAIFDEFSDLRDYGFVLIDEECFCRYTASRIRIETPRYPIYIYLKDLWKWRELCQK